LKQIVTTDVTWICFRNPDKSGQFVDQGSRPEQHPKRGQFGKNHSNGFCNSNGILLFDLLPNGQTINSEYYCELLERMYQGLRECYPDLVNQKRVILQQDNARSHSSKMTMGKIKELDGLDFYLILFIVKTWDLPIITHLSLWCISSEVSNLRMWRMLELKSKHLSTQNQRIGSATDYTNWPNDGFKP